MHWCVVSRHGRRSWDFPAYILQPPAPIKSVLPRRGGVTPGNSQTNSPNALACTPLFRRLFRLITGRMGSIVNARIVSYGHNVEIETYFWHGLSSSLKIASAKTSWRTTLRTDLTIRHLFPSFDSRLFPRSYRTWLKAPILSYPVDVESKAIVCVMSKVQQTYARMSCRISARTSKPAAMMHMLRLSRLPDATLDNIYCNTVENAPDSGSAPCDACVTCISLL